MGALFPRGGVLTVAERWGTLWVVVSGCGVPEVGKMLVAEQRNAFWVVVVGAAVPERKTGDMTK